MLNFIHQRPRAAQTRAGVPKGLNWHPRHNIRSIGIQDTPMDDNPKNHPLKSHSVFFHPIQAKLLLGGACTPEEQEADRVAQQVVEQLSTQKNISSPPDFRHPDLKQSRHDVLQRREEAGTIPRKRTTTHPVGNWISDEMETSLNKARGGGQSLPDFIQVEAERALNFDFDSVTVHCDRQADQVNHVLQSRACTSGTDIFFRAGEYQPHTPAGQELLLHELTHVVQQQQTASPGYQLVHRKIGLELQTFETAYFYAEGDIYKSPFAQVVKEVLGRGTGFAVEGDAGRVSGELELVTDAVEETRAGRQQLMETMENIEAFLSPLDNQDVSLHEFAGGGFHHEGLGDRLKHQLRLDATMGMTFHPQVTAGVRLQNLEDLMVALTNAPIAGEDERRHPTGKTVMNPIQQNADRLGWSQMHTQKPFQASMQTAHQVTSSLFGDASAQLRSFAFLVISYIQASNVQMPPGVFGDFSHVKYYMAFMSRSDLSYIYQHVLTREERQLFQRRLAQIPGVEQAPFGESQDTSVLAHNLLMGRIFGGESSFKVWLQSLPRVDTLADCLFGYGEIKGSSQKYGLESPSDIGASQQEQRRLNGLIVELRDLRNLVKVSELKDFALTAFDLIQLVNSLEPMERERSRRRRRDRPCTIL